MGLLTQGLVHTTSEDLLSLQREKLRALLPGSPDFVTIRKALDRNERLIRAGLPGALPTVSARVDLENGFREKGGVYGDHSPE